MPLRPLLPLFQLLFHLLPLIVFSFSRKSRSSYPYKLSKPVFGLHHDYNLKVSRQLSRCPEPWIGLHRT